MLQEIDLTTAMEILMNGGKVLLANEEEGTLINLGDRIIERTSASKFLAEGEDIAASAKAIQLKYSPLTPLKAEKGDIILQPPENTETPVKNQPPPTTKHTKRSIDTGKILALHNAGWSNVKIADEMGINQVTVGKYVKQLTGGKEDQ